MALTVTSTGWYSGEIDADDLAATLNAAEAVGTVSLDSVRVTLTGHQSHGKFVLKVLLLFHCTVP